MKLKCNINGQEYDIVQGAHFSEEYNETLDSGTIILDQVEKINDLKPYDDVFIYEQRENGEGFEGYGWLKIVPIEEIIDGEKITNIRFVNRKFSLSSSNVYELYVLLSENFYNILKNDSIEFFDDISVAINIKGCWTFLNSVDITLTYFFTEHKMILKNIKFSNEADLDVLSDSERKTLMEDCFLEEIEITNFTLAGNGFYTAQLTNVNSLNDTSLSGDDTVQYFIEKLTGISCYNPIVHPENKFYKHLLVDRYTEERLNPIENIFKYKIELFSETKKLETIQLPNLSITEPLKIDKKKSIWEYLNLYVKLYGPKKKYKAGIYTINVLNNDNQTNVWQWEYFPKYRVSESLKEVFEGVYSPDFTLNLPNLRDILTRLMQVKDMIPYVIDDVIYGMDITYRDTTPFNINGIISVVSSMTSDNFCNNLKTSYSNALSDENACNVVEKIGFRNSNTALMKLEDLRIETSYPIYKINNVKMCYYKNIGVFDASGDSNPAGAYLCKQDITPFVLLDTTRGLLSQDWSELQVLLDKNNPTPDEQELSKYKMMTVGYNIGSNYITGWGTKYSGIDLAAETASLYWWKFTQTYLENLLVYFDRKHPLGDTFKNSISIDNETYYYSQPNDYNIMNNIITSTKVKNGHIGEKLKSIFFEIDYIAFYNGSVLHSKDQVLENDITINDNPSSSLTVLEKEGIFQKTKVNRFGNKVYNITARYNGNQYNNMNKLGQMYQEVINHSDNSNLIGDDDIIIYHRDYSIFDNYIAVNYTGSKNAVLKNYFHSVFAKHRTWNLMSYNESVNRAENERLLLIFSKQISYLEPTKTTQFLNFDGNYINKLFNFFESNPEKLEKTQDKTYTNCAAIIKPGSYAEFYLCDFNSFVTGTSLCFNAKTKDNISYGNYIDELSPAINFAATSDTIKEDYIGTLQNIYSLVDDRETGFTKNIGFLFGKLNISPYNYKLASSSKIANVYEQYIFKLPKLTFMDGDNFYSAIPVSETDFIFNKYFKDVIYFEKNINKDNKEVIDMTFQIEALSQDDNVIISPWMLKLSDFYNKYNKINESYYAIDYSLKNNSVYLILKSDIGRYVKLDNKVYSAFSLLEILVPADEVNDLAGRVKNLLPDEYLFFSFDFSKYEGNEIINYSEGWLTRKSYFYIQKLTFDSNMTYIDVVGYAKYILGHVKYLGNKWDGKERDGETIKDKTIRFVKASDEPIDGYYVYRAYNMHSQTISSVTTWFVDVNNSSYYFNNRCPYFNGKPSNVRGILYNNSWVSQNNSKIYTQTQFYFNINDEIPYYYPYPKNLFLGVYNYKINKNFIYNSYKNNSDLGIVENTDISKIIQFDYDDEVPCLKVNLSSFNSKPESLVVWYYVNEDSIKQYYQLNNVSGIFTGNEVEIERDPNVLSDRTGDTLCPWLPGEGELYYGKYKAIYKVPYEDSTRMGQSLTDTQMSSIIHVNVEITGYSTPAELVNIDYYDDNGSKGFIMTFISDSSLDWIKYKITVNTSEIKLINGSYNFVFGVNVSDADWANKEILIYYSLLSNKDPRIYDTSNKAVGTLINYANESQRANIPYFDNIKICMPNNYVYSLQKPKNLIIDENYILRWSTVEGATSYQITCQNDSEQYLINEETTNNYLDLKEVLTDYFNNGILRNDVSLEASIHIKSLSNDPTKYEDSFPAYILLKLNIAEE